MIKPLGEADEDHDQSPIDHCCRSYKFEVKDDNGECEMHISVCFDENTDTGELIGPFHLDCNDGIEQLNQTDLLAIRDHIEADIKASKKLEKLPKWDKEFLELIQK